MQGIELLRSLRCVRSFSDRPIPDTMLRDVLDVARWTGSSKNTQPWELIVVEDRGTLEALSRCGPYAGHLAGARVAVALVMQPGTTFDEGRLAQNIMLAAWAYGIGSCIASLYPEENEQRARELLGVPQDLRVHTALSLGFPSSEQARRLSGAPAGTRSTVPLGRRPLSELVIWERYGERRVQSGDDLTPGPSPARRGE